MNIIVADQSLITRRGLLSIIDTALLSQDSNDNLKFNMVREAGSSCEIYKLLHKHCVDILFLSFTLMTSISASPNDHSSLVKCIAGEFPNTKIIVLSPYRNANIVRKMFKDGAVGYISYDICEQDLWRAIDAVHHDEIYVEKSLMNLVFREKNDINKELRNGHYNVAVTQCVWAVFKGPLCG